MTKMKLIHGEKLVFEKLRYYEVMIPPEFGTVINEAMCVVGLSGLGLGGLITYGLLRRAGWKSEAETQIEVANAEARHRGFDYNNLVRISKNMGRFFRAPGAIRIKHDIGEE